MWGEEIMSGFLLTAVQCSLTLTLSAERARWLGGFRPTVLLCWPGRARPWWATGDPQTQHSQSQHSLL